MQGIDIIALKHISTTEKGGTYEFESNRIGTMVLGRRNAQTVNGRHYHSGISVTKNPEVFILLSGTIELNAKNLLTDEIFSLIIKEPIQINIHPYVWHEIIANTEIVFIELNSLQEHIDDTHYSDILPTTERPILV
ncbi:MAG: hypothetical protein SGJ04_00205 [Bacteroidota bacterium]|nr:hypothetical protein [Bacteroidota bacterium]